MGTELQFRITGAHAVPHAAAPALALTLEVSSVVEVRSLLLQAQVRIDAPARAYSAQEREALRELFGDPARWSRTLTGLLWANVQALVRPFDGTTDVELMLPVTADLSLACGRYFDAVGGAVPLVVLFSGTVFYARDDGTLQTRFIPWSAEARYAFPTEVWKQTIDLHFPNRAVLSVDRGLLERLHREQLARGLTSLDRTLEALLEARP
jgi:hypothetical protein